MPTAFSPDGDSKNDLFGPKFTNVIETGYEFYVYDRWGEIIFSTNQLSEQWDGKAKGNAYVQSGVYTYLVRYKDIYEIAHEKAGVVTVIR